MMPEHPPMELYVPSTPQEAWAGAVTRARVDDDGTLASWSAAGHRGGTMRITASDGWAAAVYAQVAGR